MNDWYRSWLVENNRRADEIAEAEKYRLLKQAGLTHPMNFKRYQRLLYNLGALMMAWGDKLQSHYEGWIQTEVDHRLPESLVEPRTDPGL
jgi:hypothetical protein